MNNLDKFELKVAELVGVSESYIANKASVQRTRKVRPLQLCWVIGTYVTMPPQFDKQELQQKCREIYTILRNKHFNEQNILHRYEYCKQNSLRDITNRKKTESSIRRSETKKVITRCLNI